MIENPMQAGHDDFFEEVPRGAVPDGAMLVVDLDGYEGPLDVLLALAREQKVDLKRISILALAEQYLAFIQAARELQLELAADYLVMAAWLAYLKSRLLLPEPPGEEEPSGEEMAARLTYQLRRLEAMREAASRLMTRHRLGQEIFPRGAPEGVKIIRRSVYDLSLYHLLRAYADHRVSRGNPAALRLRRSAVYSLEEALTRFGLLLGRMPEWSTLAAFLPEGIADPFTLRSALASTFLASLELSRQGKLEVKQGKIFGPIYLRRIGAGEEP